MTDREKEKAFAEQLARETAKHETAISAIFANSNVGQCRNACKGFKEKDLADLCPECLEALEEATDKIFSLSPEMGLLGDIMNKRS